MPAPSSGSAPPPRANRSAVFRWHLPSACHCCKLPRCPHSQPLFHLCCCHARWPWSHPFTAEQPKPGAGWGSHLQLREGFAVGGGGKRGWGSAGQTGQFFKNLSAASPPAPRLPTLGRQGVSGKKNTHFYNICVCRPREDEKIQSDYGFLVLLCLPGTDLSTRSRWGS